jgi:DUF4097 and DUF4098 domain-containing protein YvlB
MDSKTRIAVIVSVFLAAAGWAVAGGDYEETFDQYYQLAAGGRVALENVNGDVSIEVWERDEVRVYAVKSASSAELLDGLEIKVDAGNGGVEIDTEYPSTRHHDSGDHSYSSREHSFMKVEYTLTVPRTARLDDIDLVNGNLSVIGVEGGVSAATVNGNIVVRNCAGDTELGTVNGGIEAHVDRLDPGESLGMESVNGRLDLHLASSIGAEMRAESVNGRLTNDFGIDVRKGKYVGSDFRGTVGGGGADVALETVNGSINVHRW